MTLELDQLDVLQASKNDGKGIECVRRILDFLKQNDQESAVSLCIQENDKICEHKEIVSLLRKLLPTYNTMHLNLVRKMY